MYAYVARHAVAMPGVNCRITRTANGSTLRPDASAFRWRHPWHRPAVAPATDWKIILPHQPTRD